MHPLKERLFTMDYVDFINYQTDWLRIADIGEEQFKWIVDPAVVVRRNLDNSG